MDGVSITVKNLNKTIKQFVDGNMAVLEEVDMILGEGAVNIATKAKANAPVDMGYLRNSISFRQKGFLGWVVSVNAFYAPYIEFGTKTYVEVPKEFESIAQLARQQKRKGSFKDLVQNIYKWVKRKGVGGVAFSRVKAGKNKGKTRANRQATKWQQMAIAYQIAFVIAKKGIKPQPYLYPAYREEVVNMRNKLKRIFNK